MKKCLLIIGLLILFLNAFPQVNPDYKLWSSVDRLTVQDFGIKKIEAGSDLCFAQFTMEYNVKGFDFLTKNFNKKIKTYFIKSASWINPYEDVDYSLQYQQTLFDLYEIYTRKFRKELKENRKRLVKGVDFIQEINSNVSSELSRRRLQYESETRHGRDLEKQTLWEHQIRKELDEFADFDYSK